MNHCSSHLMDTGFKKLTHLGPKETETAESKSAEPIGPTLVFSTFNPVFVRSNLLVSLFLNKLAASK
uniref:Uncharacterized protein MANES_07G014700 n=1 Tax=Rhizophora mucronata TaxID=61149 RepID=A0A2P2LJ31_RHIMU